MKPVSDGTADGMVVVGNTVGSTVGESAQSKQQKVVEFKKEE